MKDRQPTSALHRKFAVETPEHVRLDYVLADVGSRAAALAIDFTILFVTLTLVGFVADRLGLLDDALRSIVRPLFIILLFLAQWGYFFLFEALWGGRTPGKRALGLRVVHTGGEPVSPHGAALRNLLRIVDLGVGLVGVLSILVSSRAQRLGDLVGGTVVLHDAGGSALLGADELPPGRVGRPVLSVEQFELLAGYMARRDGLKADVRRRVARSLRDALAAVIEQEPGHRTRTADENLARLYEEEAPRHAARRGGASLQAAAMAREQREEWARYIELVEKGRKRGLPSLTEEEVRAFGQLYRGVTADLARARTYGASPGLMGTVQRWAGAGHNLLYRTSGRVAVSLGHWVAVEFPRAVRRFHRQVLLASLLLFGPHAGDGGSREGPARAGAHAGGAGHDDPGRDHRRGRSRCPLHRRGRGRGHADPLGQAHDQQHPGDPDCVCRRSAGGARNLVCAHQQRGPDRSGLRRLRRRRQAADHHVVRVPARLH